MAPNTGKVVAAEAKKNINNDRVFQVRTRFTLAQINAGATLLPALRRAAYRMVDAIIIAIGGAAAVGTTVDILATQGGSAAKLVAAAQAGLTQSTIVRAGSATGAVLADGASFVANDLNTAITVGKTGTDFTTATHFDFLVTYMIDGPVDQ